MHERAGKTSKLSDVKTSVDAAEFLSLLRGKVRYDELSKQLGLSPPVISRYVKGKVLPHPERARRIISLAGKKALSEMVRSKILRGRDNIYDMTPMIYDVTLQRFIAKLVFQEFKDSQVDCVLTAETAGVPLTVQVANELGVGVVIAKKTKELGVENFLEERVVFSPSVVEYLYVPRNAIKKDDGVLIVDDIMRTGITVETLTKLVSRFRARTVGIYSAVAFGDAAEKLGRRLSFRCPVRSLVNLPEH